MPLAILAILLFGIAGIALFRVVADGKPPSVLLKWHPPPPKPGVTVTGYNVYRSLPGGSFELLTSVVAPTYVDTKVSRGTTYYYFVTAVDTTGKEGPFSNQVSATVP